MENTILTKAYTLFIVTVGLFISGIIWRRRLGIQ